jgi:hypothetical protein
MAISTKRNAPALVLNGSVPRPRPGVAGPNLYSHIPNRGEQMVRDYGHYRIVSRPKRQMEGCDDRIPCIIEPQGNKKNLLRKRPPFEGSRAAFLWCAGVRSMPLWRGGRAYV